MVFSASRRAIFFLTLPPLSKNWSKKRNRGRWGGGPGSAICGRNPCFFVFQNGGRWGGGPGRFLVVGEFCLCLSLFTGLFRVSGSFKFKRQFRLIYGRILSLRARRFLETPQPAALTLVDVG